MFTFPVKTAFGEKVIAGIHQTDRTARAQLVTKQLYPELHHILNGFFQKTGIPAILNTSFNLHGWPIVTGSLEAVEVFINSEIDVLVIDDWVVERHVSDREMEG